jgi:hypothetical protein
MFFFRKKSEMVAPEKALRGRADPIATARTHFLNGRELKGPYPDGIERAMFGMGCFWVLRPNRPQRGCPCRLRPGEAQLRSASENVLGEP